jgi:hypothetical protein
MHAACNKASIPIDLRLPDEISRSISNELCLGTIINERGELVGEVDHESRAKGCSDAEGNAPHAIIDLSW